MTDMILSDEEVEEAPLPTAEEALKAAELLSRFVHSNIENAYYDVFVNSVRCHYKRTLLYVFYIPLLTCDKCLTVKDTHENLLPDESKTHPTNIINVKVWMIGCLVLNHAPLTWKRP
ncbi:jg19939 [Pararge aegeria aegeria]|uniref:Jg19939 protein n=1 Tax=Pararge aegeria aegeria TaxID=348720 RepID=A0A8S4RYQ4_9NEOP|nr:jg19939 [Pararge aegeria aegeria]